MPLCRSGGVFCSRWLRLLLAAILCPSAALAQSADAGAKNEGQEISASPIATGTPTLKAKVHMVLLDVVVTKGLHNEPVAGLTQGDFSVFEDRKAQRILSFAAHAGNAPVPENTPKEPPLPAGMFLNITSPAEYGTPNVLLYDALNTAPADQPYARDEVVKFLRKKPPGARFAIFVLSGRLHLLQGFTEDPDLLIDAVNRGAGRPLLSPMGLGEPDQSSSAELFSESGAPESDGSLSLSLNGLQNMERAEAEYVAGRRIEATIRAFREIDRFLSGTPGRKNLIWLAGSFPTGVFPGRSSLDMFDAFAAATSYTSELRAVTTQLVLSQIAIYPVDARGLVVGMADAAAPGTAESVTERSRNSLQSMAAEHIMMDEIAQDSGGRAFYNTNGLTEAISAATRQGTNYYTLSYSPSDRNFNGRYRKIRVKLSKKGYHLSYRRSYFAGDSSAGGDVQRAPVDRLEAVMQRGAPTEHEILFKVLITPTGTPVAPSSEQLDAMKKIEAFAEKKDLSSMKLQRYSLRLAILGSLLTLPDSGRSLHSLRVEFASDAFDTESRRVASGRWLAQNELSRKKYDAIKQDACRLSQEIEVPSNAAWLRLAVKDLASGRIGSLEIPLPVSGKNSMQQPMNH